MGAAIDNRAVLPLALLAATSVAFTVGERPAAVALTGERVLWASPAQDGRVVVHEAPLSGGRPRVVMRIAAAHPRSVSLAANASGFVAAVRGPGGDRVEGIFGGVRHSLVDCRSTEPLVPLRVVAGRRGFALAGTRCGLSAVELVASDGTRSAVEDLYLYGAYRLAYNEPFLAVTAGLAPPAQYVRVLDLDLGTERAVQPSIEGDLAVLADGTLLAGNASGIFAWPPSGPRTRLTRAGGAFAAAATGVAFIAGSRARFVPLGGGPAKRLRVPGSAVGPVAFDGTRAAFTHVTCDNVLQVAVVDVRLPARRPRCPPRGVAG